MSATLTSQDGTRNVEVTADALHVIIRDSAGNAVADQSVTIKDAPANAAAGAQPVITVDPSGNYIAPSSGGGGGTTADAAGRDHLNSMLGDRIFAKRRDTVSVDFIFGLVEDAILLEHRWDYTGTTLQAGEVVDGYVGAVPTGALAIVDKIVGAVVTLEVLRGPFTTGHTVTGRTSAGTGTISAGIHMRAATTNGVLTLASSSLVEKTEVYSRQIIPHIPGHDGYAVMSLRWPSGGALGLWAYGGAMNGNNGVAIGYLDTAFGVLHRRFVGAAAVDTFIPQASFSLDRLDGTGSSGITLDPTRFNTFRMVLSYINSTVVWEIKGVDLKWHPFHAITEINTGTSGIVRDPNTPCRVEVNRTAANASSVSIESTAWCAGTLGPDKPSGRDVVVVSQKAHLGGNNDLPLVSFHNPTTFNGVRNRSSLTIDLASLGSVGGKGVIMKFWKNAKLLGALFADHQTGQRFTQVDTAATALVLDAATGLPSGQLVGAYVMRDKSGRDIKGTMGMTISPGESLTVTGISTQAADLIAAVTAVED